MALASMLRAREAREASWYDPPVRRKYPVRSGDGGDADADADAPSRSLLAVASGLSRRLPSSRWKQRGGRVLAATVAWLGGSAVVPVTLRDGSTVILDGRGRTEAEPFWTGTYEADLVAFLRRCTTIYGGHVVDVGANVGLISIPLARAGATVTAIEPVPENAARIRRSALLSGVVDRVRVVEVALGEPAGSVTMVREDGMGATTGNALDASIAFGYRYFSFVSGTELAEQDPREGLGDVVAVPDGKVARLPAHVRGRGPWTG